jgi:hypothetical protein
MNARTRKTLLVGVALCLSGGLLAQTTPAVSSATHTENAGSQTTAAATTPADRFTSNRNYCRVFLNPKDTDFDGDNTGFTAALDDAIEANGGDVKGTFSMIREKCAALV